MLRGHTVILYRSRLNKNITLYYNEHNNINVKIRQN